jgi:hypothetical protein
MSIDFLRSIARKMVDQLVNEDYGNFVDSCVESRLTSSDLRTVIRDYGRTLMSPPPNAYMHIDVVKVNSAAVPTWSVRVPLWTKEEGRSDLTLEMTVCFGPGSPSVRLDDLQVL